jgi:hypothetical protein
MRRIILGLMACLLLSEPLRAQLDTDIFLIPVEDRDSSSWTFGMPRNLTPRKGYDNQPCFTKDSRGLLFVSADAQGQTDIYRYDLFTQINQRLTDTRRRSEYSPTPRPDGKGFTAVVVEEDSTQRLWTFRAGDEGGEVLMEGVTQVGYHAWYDRKRVGLFVLTEPQTLQVTRVKRPRPLVLADSIGRSLSAAPGKRRLSYVDQGHDPWLIKVWDARKERTEVVTPTLPGYQDYTWTPEGYLLMARENHLYRFRPGLDATWQDLGDLGVGNFYRLALSPDGRWLAVVTYQGAKP